MHRLTNIDTDRRVATCAECGPEVRVRFRAHRNHWACVASDRRLSAEGTERRRMLIRAWGKRNRHRQKKHGLTRQQIADLSESQGHVCAICGGADSVEPPLVLDHDHASGKPRGMLCRACNLALGFMRDDITRLMQAAEYLRAVTATTS